MYPSVVACLRGFKDDNIEINLLKGIIKYICITKRDVVFSKEINISIDINPNSVL